MMQRTAPLLGRRTAVSIREQSLIKDADGLFDDVDAFWEAASKPSRSLAIRQRSKPSVSESVQIDRSSYASTPARRRLIDEDEEEVADEVASRSPQAIDVDARESSSFAGVEMDDDVYNANTDESEDVDGVDAHDSVENNDEVESSEATPAFEESKEEVTEVVDSIDNESESEEDAQSSPIEKPAARESGVYIRRSRRQKFPVMQFWKNERVIYTLDTEIEAPTATAVELAEPTPRPKKRKKKSTTSLKIDDEITPSEFFADDEGGQARIWDEPKGRAEMSIVVSRAHELESKQLPASSDKRPSDAPLTLAAQALSAESYEIESNLGLAAWLSGQLVMPPRAVKDEESVGLCSQVFFVASSQPGGLELAIASPSADSIEPCEFEPNTAVRFLLSPGDQFHIPPNNMYRIENRSNSQSATLFWCIMRPLDISLTTPSELDYTNEIKSHKPQDSNSVRSPQLPHTKKKSKQTPTENKPPSTQRKSSSAAAVPAAASTKNNHIASNNKKREKSTPKTPSSSSSSARRR